MSMMVYTGTPARYIAMAAADRLEWVPTSAASKPRTSFPIAVTRSRIRSRTCLDVTRPVVPSAFWYVQTGESAEVPGMRRTRRMMEAHAMTGHIAASPVRCMVMVTSRSSFF